MATAPSPQPSRFSVSPGVDYEVLWKRLEEDLLKFRTSAAEQICIASEIEKIKVLQGAWGSYGFIYNHMQAMIATSRGDEPTES